MGAALPDTDRTMLETLAPAFAASWSVNGGLSADALEYTANWLFDTEEFAGLSTSALLDWVDFTPVDAALATLGVVDSMDSADR
ncbi:hypothetical protein D3C87_1864590 [compost metagenome]